MLLEALSSIKGRFLLSSYPCELLDAQIEKYGWCSHSMKMAMCVNNRIPGRKKSKTEVLTANYAFEIP